VPVALVSSLDVVPLFNAIVVVIFDAEDVGLKVKVGLDPTVERIPISEQP